ncbi:hypothetical protein EJ05DRAFT_152658 [Pseudovirgaria hyperparasitica]|uniref:Uncharacterized protein n=1 Tax=Pseudovirgaria hyperparasitica TaxID=470096 RepID=A0A6A6VWI1_9PEZI|nr:uncharacterized protein EJ05DRAFT_152658 [Pseudovirgaria hyperparasitica]KAF2754209.1 hypothetical protein EJ05DRAFT_152658 [Pseudovirgaria hyperparasitica]
MLGVVVMFMQGVIGTREGILTRKARVIEGLKRYSVIACTLCFIVVQVLDIITLTSFMDWKLRPFTFFYYPVFSELLWRITELGYAIYAMKKYTSYFRALYMKRSLANTFIYVAWALAFFMCALTAVSWGFLTAYWIMIAHHGTQSITYDNALNLGEFGDFDKAKHIGNGYESVMVVWSLFMIGSVVYVWKVKRDCYPPRPANAMDLDAQDKYNQSEPYNLAYEVTRFRSPLIIVSSLFCLKGLEQIIGTHVGPLEYHHWGPAYITDTVVSILWRLLVIAIGASLFLLPIKPPMVNAESYAQTDISTNDIVKA